MHEWPFKMGIRRCRRFISSVIRVAVAVRVEWNIMMAYSSILTHFQDTRLNQVTLLADHIETTVKINNEKRVLNPSTLQRYEPQVTLRIPYCLTTQIVRKNQELYFVSFYGQNTGEN
jgi:hypothetical protein